jgi:hypothetical protein
VDDLTPDDVSAVCDVYGPDKPIGAGCRMARGAGDAGWLLAAAAAMCALRRRRGFAVLLALVFMSGSAGAKKPRAKRRAPRPPVQLATAADEALVHHEEETLPSPAPAAEEPPRALEPPHDEPPPPLPTPRTTDLWTGARYRAFALPRALVDLVGRSNRDLFFQSASVEADFRGDHFSFVPALTFADLATGDVLLGSKGTNVTSSFSYLKSDMKAVAGSASFLWSVPVSRVVDLEIGFEIGLAVTFGPLVDHPRARRQLRRAELSHGRQGADASALGLAPARRRAREGRPRRRRARWNRGVAHRRLGRRVARVPGGAKVK